MFRKIIFILAIANLVSCVERDVYQVNHPAVVRQVNVVPEQVITNEPVVITEPTIIPTERVIYRRRGRFVERVIVRP